ncbi:MULTISPECIES: hypothetical protein [unclassified Roseitalea]|uniref:hypothetical protein n=1 Tax=unclassified Roseitalea TaxID=2639107 RepID=UPI00273D9EF0|nr:MULTISPECIES: hypothetical protein [unclassified Roseitalea]
MHQIDPTYGRRQQFRYRLADLTFPGVVNGLNGPPDKASIRLNGGGTRPLYVETVHDEGVDWLNSYKKTPSELRCRHFGEFCVEIPHDDTALRPGPNRLDIAVSADGAEARCEILFDWDPMPLSPTLDLSDLSRFHSIQEVGQIVNGAFDLDRSANLIRSRAPVAPDALLVIGSRGQSQEATYRVRFTEPNHSKWLGLSDFHAGMVEGIPPRGIKVGWSSAGMAVAMPSGGARSFLAWGDHSGAPEEWAIATNPPAQISVQRGRAYRVRHQILLNDAVNRVRFRIWPEDEPEPSDWVCDEHDGRLPADMPRHQSASFGLFQHMGMPVEWSDIRLRPMREDEFEPVDPASGREPFFKRDRPGAF